MNIDSNILPYLKDTYFLKYVFESTPSQLRYWRGYIARKPMEKEYVLRAKYVLLHLDEMTSMFTPQEIEHLKKRITTSIKG